jgi:hypothetical protein
MCIDLLHVVVLDYTASEIFRIVAQNCGQLFHKKHIDYLSTSWLTLHHAYWLFLSFSNVMSKMLLRMVDGNVDGLQFGLPDKFLLVYKFVLPEGYLKRKLCYEDTKNARENQ